MQADFKFYSQIFVVTITADVIFVVTITADVCGRSHPPMLV